MPKLFGVAHPFMRMLLIVTTPVVVVLAFCSAMRKAARAAAQQFGWVWRALKREYRITWDSHK